MWLRVTGSFPVKTSSCWWFNLPWSFISGKKVAGEFLIYCECRALSEKVFFSFLEFTLPKFLCKFICDIFFPAHWPDQFPTQHWGGNAQHWFLQIQRNYVSKPFDDEFWLAVSLCRQWINIGFDVMRPGSRRSESGHKCLLLCLSSPQCINCMKLIHFISIHNLYQATD